MPKNTPLSQQDFVKFVDPQILKTPGTDHQVSKVARKCSCPDSAHTELLNDFSEEISEENSYGFSATPAFQGLCEKHGFYDTSKDNKDIDLMEHKTLHVPSDEDFQEDLELDTLVISEDEDEEEVSRSEDPDNQICYCTTNGAISVGLENTLPEDATKFLFPEVEEGRIPKITK